MAEIRSALASVCDHGSQATIECAGVYCKELPIGDLISVSAWPDSFERVSDALSAALNIKMPGNLPNSCR